MRKRKTIYNWSKILSYNIISKVAYTFVFAILPSTLISCNDDNDQSQSITQVLLVYLASDNSLADEGPAKLEAIASGMDNNPSHRILVYLDTRGLAPRLMEIREKNRIETIEEYKAENSADPAVFRRVILNAKERYPQASFNLLVFSHASGWLPQGSLLAPKSSIDLKSIITDGTAEMDIIDFASAIPDNAFESITFEACFMAGIEVAYQLKNKTNYILASSAEILSPGFTPLYKDIIPLQFNGITGLIAFASKAFAYWNNQTGNGRSATFSIIDTQYLDILANYVRENCDLTHQANIADYQHFDRYSYRLFFDFQEYYSQMLPENKQEVLRFLIGSTVLWKASTPSFLINNNGFDIHSHSGMTVYIAQEQFILLNTAYKNLEWYNAIGIESP
ncbi:MAG: clostripain-related cysteine peptidase [Dysgonomonas sp.]